MDANRRPLNFGTRISPETVTLAEHLGGLASAEAQTYNSLCGTVLLWDAATERYDVRIRDPPHSGDIIAVKPSKLQVLAE